jgi:integrase
MLKSTKRKTGRHRGYHTDRHGNKIDGLTKLKDGRWRTSRPFRYTFTEADEDRAIARFRQWQQEKSGSNAGTIQSFVDHHVASRVWAQRVATSHETTITVSANGPSIVTDPSLRPEQWVWLRTQLADRPKWVAEMLGVEQIGYLQDIPKPTPSPTLEEVGKLYLDNPKISPNWKSKATLFWQEFKDAVGVKTLREIMQEHVVTYSDVVTGAAVSPTYIRQRFGTIRTILNFPPKRAKWALDCKRALAFCSVLVKPKKAATDPKPIDPKEFAKLLEKADPQMKAILLAALNFCMYGAEVAVLNWSDVDLEKMTLSTSRNKTGIVRVATIWPETAAALRELPRNQTDAMFLTAIGTQADSLCIYRLFKPVRKAASLEAIQFSQVRDSAYTAAVEAGVDLNICRILAGHSSGISDHYVKRRPQMVKDACDAIRSAYGIGSA